GIDECSGNIRNKVQVRLVDGLETTNAGTVKADTRREDVFVKIHEGNAEMLHHSANVHEVDIDFLHSTFTRPLEECCGRCHFCRWCKRGGSFLHRRHT